MIMANETRSRFSWMNSFTNMAHVLRQKPPPGRRCAVWGGSRCVIGNCPCVAAFTSPPRLSPPRPPAPHPPHPTFSHHTPCLTTHHPPPRPPPTCHSPP